MATTASANTTNVTTAELVKVEPLNAAELIKTVEVNLALSMEQVKVTLDSPKNSQQLLTVQTRKQAR